MTHPFLKASIPELLREMKREEKISLLGAKSYWATKDIPRLNIPSVRMSDGPNLC